MAYPKPFGSYASLVTSFTGADENPISDGGNWALLNSSATAMQRISNAVAPTSSTSGSYWTPQDYGPNVEAYITLSTASAFNAEILVRVKDEGGAGTFDGYSVRAATTSLSIARYTNSTAAALITRTVTIGNGDLFGIRMFGPSIEVYLQTSGSGVWTFIVSVSDANFPLGGKIAVKGANTAIRMDDLYAATIPSEASDAPPIIYGYGAR